MYKTVHKVVTAQKYKPKLKTIRTTIEESPGNDKYYKITGGLASI